MIDGKFDVVFRGQITKKHSLDEVKASLVSLFKSTPDAIEKLFAGSEVAIRKNLDYSEAMKYQSALKNVGALALIKEVEASQQAEQTSQKAAPEAEPANTSVQSEEPKSDSSSEMPEASSPKQEKPEQKSSVTEDSDDFTMASVGEQILPPKVYEKRDVDTSSLSLANTGERILPEKPPESHPQPSIDHLSLDDN